MAFSCLQLAGRRRARSSPPPPGILTCFKRLDVRRVVLDLAAVVSHGADPSEKIVGEILAPERAVGDARLGQRAVEIEHADQAGPGAAPVGDGQDRARDACVRPART